jgi:hypothetical protein
MLVGRGKLNLLLDACEKQGGKLLRLLYESPSKNLASVQNV